MKVFLNMDLLGMRGIWCSDWFCYGWWWIVEYIFYDDERSDHGVVVGYRIGFVDLVGVHQ